MLQYSKNVLGSDSDGIHTLRISRGQYRDQKTVANTLQNTAKYLPLFFRHTKPYHLFTIVPNNQIYGKESCVLVGKKRSVYPYHPIALLILKVPWDFNWFCRKYVYDFSYFPVVKTFLMIGSKFNLFLIFQVSLQPYLKYLHIYSNLLFLVL